MSNSPFRKQVRPDFAIDLSAARTISPKDIDRAVFPVYDMTGPRFGRKSIGKMTMKEFLEKFG